MGDPAAQLSRVNLNDGVADVQDEEYEFIPGGQETNGRASGVSRSDRAVSSTLSSKAGIILVSLPSLPLICGSLFIFISFIPKGYPQHLHCHSPIPRCRIRGCPICYS
jgi:hypothetical protein